MWRLKSPQDLNNMNNINNYQIDHAKIKLARELYDLIFNLFQVRLAKDFDDNRDFTSEIQEFIDKNYDVKKSVRDRVEIENRRVCRSLGLPELNNSEVFKCCSCGTNKNLEYSPEPYNQDIHGDNTNVLMCDKCRNESARDI